MASTVAAWPTVALGEVLALDVDAVLVNASESYPIAGVYSFGRGLLARSPLLGTDTTYKVFHRLHTDQFVLSQLKAWEGALARVSVTFDGWYLSPQFPTFRADANRLDIAFLEWYCRQAIVWEQLRSSARGMGARRDSVTPAQFLRLPIPLPPLDEQRRIVARIEALAARIAEARGLRQAAMAEAGALWAAGASSLLDAQRGAANMPLGDIVSVQGGGTPSKSNPLFWVGDIPWVSPKDMKSRRICDSHDHISEDAVAWSTTRLLEPGTVLIVTRGMILAHTVPVAVLEMPATINQDMKALTARDGVVPEYLCGVLWALNHELLQHVERSSHDTRKLETSKLLDFEIPVPDLATQAKLIASFDDLQRQVEALLSRQSETGAELDLLLPSLLDKAFRGEL